jgi:hypothetical protein
MTEPVERSKLKGEKKTQSLGGYMTRPQESWIVLQH